MAKISVSGWSGSLAFSLEVTEQSYNAVANTSVVKWTLSATGGGGTWFDFYLKASVNGTSIWDESGSWSKGDFPAADGSRSGTMTIAHGADGKKSISFHLEGYRQVYTTKYADGSLTLTDIDRNAPAITLNDISGITASGLTITATSTSECKDWYYKINDGEWTLFQASKGTSASYTFTGLEPATEYTVKVKATRDYNGVEGESSEKSATTLGGAVINSVNPLVVNESGNLVLNVTVYNATYENKLTLKKGSTTILNEWSIGALSVGTKNITVALTSAQRELIYSAMSTVKEETFSLSIKSYDPSLIGGGNSKDVLMTISSSASPTLNNFAFEDSNATTVAVSGDNQKLIQGQSTLKIKSLSASAKNGASISEWKYEVANQSKTGTPTSGNFNFGVVNVSGSAKIKVTVTDSRGYSVSKEVNVTSLSYTPIQINDYGLHRQNSNEVTTLLTLQGRFTSVGNNSFQRAFYKYRIKGGSTWSSEINFSPSVSGTSISFDNILDTTHFLTSNDYEVYIELRDKLTSVYVTGIVLKALYLMMFRNDKVGINTIDPQFTLDIRSADALVDADVGLNGVNIALYFHPVGSVIKNVGDFNPNVWGGTWTHSGNEWTRTE